jgi:hypothetical protein
LAAFPFVSGALAVGAGGGADVQLVQVWEWLRWSRLPARMY